MENIKQACMKSTACWTAGRKWSSVDT